MTSYHKEERVTVQLTTSAGEEILLGIIPAGNRSDLKSNSKSRSAVQSCKSGGAFRVGLGFGPGSGLTFRKTSGLFRA